MALVKETVDALNQSGGGGGAVFPAAAANIRTEIRVFPLRYAWAADFTYSADGEDHTLPGVVSVLRDLYPASVTVVSSVPTVRQTKLGRLRGMGYFRDEQVSGSAAERLTPVAPRQDSSVIPEGAYPEAGPSVNTSLPQFQADGRMNAVIVRDIPERIALYEDVIRSLDVKPALVEIEARIIEISEDDIGTLGINWIGHSGSASVAVAPGHVINNAGSMSTSGNGGSTGTTSSSGVIGIPNIATQGLTTPLIIPPSQLPTGGVLTTVLGDAGRSLLVRINALADHGKAHIISSPRVLTLDNVEAVLENMSTFYVPVAGNLDVGLFNVSAGTSMRVTPLLVTEGGRTQIKLAVRVEDGGLTQQNVGNIPVVQRTTITTQAFINEGESLLIGGYKNDVRNDTQVGVPGLSSIPVLGALFRYKQKAKSHLEHLFMLTPRVVDR